jgi:hypothetical protein
MIDALIPAFAGRWIAKREQTKLPSVAAEAASVIGFVPDARPAPVQGPRTRPCRTPPVRVFLQRRPVRLFAALAGWQ